MAMRFERRAVLGYRKPKPFPVLHGMIAASGLAVETRLAAGPSHNQIG
jgi:hypothetical protein